MAIPFILLTPEAIPSVVLASVWFLALRRARYSGWRVAMLSLVGTTGHELLHAGVGWVLCAKPTSFSIFPKRNGNTWVLGSVGFTNLNIWNSAPVAFAPLLLAGVGLLVFQHWMLPSFLGGLYLTWLLAGYVVACCFFACIPSSTDLRVGALSALMYSGIGYGLWRLTA